MSGNFASPRESGERPTREARRETTETGRKGFRSWIQTLLSLRSLSATLPAICGQFVNVMLFRHKLATLIRVCAENTSGGDQ